MTFKKWYLNMLGGGGEGDAADQYDTTDATPGNGVVDVQVGSNIYSLPKALFANVGSDGTNKETYQSRAWMASLYAAYRLSTGKDLSAILNGADPKTDASRDAMITELKRWYSAETNGESALEIPANWNKVNLDELVASDKSFQTGITGYIGSGSVKVNGTNYNNWRTTQPRLQPGYSEEYGVPVGKDAAGAYIYETEDGTGYINNAGAVIADFTGATDITGKPIVFNPASNQLETETGAPVVPGNSPIAPVTPVDDAFNQYYNDLFSLKEGTLGKKSLDNKTSLYEKESTNALALANAGRQSQAMVQAQGIKAVTDQIRAERLAQLRGGMSEAQLADRELQMLMSSVDQINGQAQMANQEATAAQFAKTTAKEQAFNDYMAEATVLGQTAAANYAGEAGDLLAQAEKYRREQAALGITVTPQAALDAVSGYHPTSGTN